MPWKETCPMDQRIRFIAAFQSERYTMSALARQFGISRKTAYKWAHRYAREGVVGLEERSRRPHRSPRAVDEATEAALLETKRRFPDWGPGPSERTYATGGLSVIGRRPARSIGYSGATAWSSPGGGDGRGPRPIRSPCAMPRPRTISGARTSRASSAWAIGNGAIR